MQLDSRERGFTLLETVLYIALLAILVGGGMVGVYNILEGSGRTLQSTHREQEAYFVTRKIDAILSEATDINDPVPDGDSTFLSVDTESGEVRIDLDGEQITLERNSSEHPLNDDSIPASDLSFGWNSASSTLNATFTLDSTHVYSISSYYYED